MQKDLLRYSAFRIYLQTNCTEYPQRWLPVFTARCFDGLKDLEKAGNRTQIDEYCYESSDAAFDVACNALKALL